MASGTRAVGLLGGLEGTQACWLIERGSHAIISNSNMCCEAIVLGGGRHLGIGLGFLNHLEVLFSLGIL